MALVGWLHMKTFARLYGAACLEQHQPSSAVARLCTAIHSDCSDRAVHSFFSATNNMTMVKDLSVLKTVKSVNAQDEGYLCI